MKNNKIVVTILIWVLLIGTFFLAYSYLNSSINEERSTIDYTRFTKLVASGNIKQIKIEGSKIFGRTKNQEPFLTYVPTEVEDGALMPLLQEHNVQITVIPVVIRNYNWIWYLVGPIVLMVIFFVFFLRSTNSAMNTRNEFSKSKAKRFTNRYDKKVTFVDVAGVDEVLEEVKEVVEFLKDPKSFGRLGGRVPKGILLKGAPGTGKTLLARAVAGEASVPFFSVSGSEFVEMFVGVGAARVRDLFEEARKAGSCIIFIDEMDALGRQRSANGYSNSHDEASQTLNQLLVEMDGIESSRGIVIMAATNRPDVLDAGLTRAGRFDRHIEVPKPDIKGREAILRIHSKDIKMDSAVDLQKIAQATSGMVGADLENIVNEAALIATRAKKEMVEEVDFYEAVEKVGMGPACKSRKMNNDEKRLMAIHEAGHALIGVIQKDFPQVLRRVSIISRGGALGLTWFMLPEDTLIIRKKELYATLRVSLAGRAAEEAILQDISTSAANDFARVTQIVRAMICEWGLGELGPISIGTTRGNAFLSFQMRDDSEVSEATKQRVDEELEVTVRDIYKETLTAVRKNRVAIEQIAKFLTEKETISAEEVLEIVEKLGVDKVKTV